MKRRLILLFLLLLPTWAWAEIPSVLLVSFDGAHPGIVRELLDAGRLPTLAGLIAGGGRWHDLTFTDQRPDYATATKAGHAQMHTGQDWRQNGVRTNVDWDGPLPLSDTLLGQWKAAGATTGWFVSKSHLWKMTRQQPTPFFDVVEAATCSGRTTDIVRTTDKALECLNTVLTPWFFFVHYHWPDDMGHGYGSGSSTYREAIVAVDAQLARIIAVIPAGVQVVVTTDHGFGTVPSKISGVNPTCEASPGSHKHHWCDQTWAISWPALDLGTRLRDIAPTLRGLLP